MGIKRTLGGDRLGSGRKMSVDMHGYGRSTHDLTKVFRSSMAAGTIVPCVSTIALPGDTWDIELEALIMTHPTLGPLLGSYKVQVDAFCTAIRLYNSSLHNNKVNIGMNMASIKLPQIIVEAIAKDTITENSQINASAILKYLGMSGIGRPGTGYVTGDVMQRSMNATGLLVYWDIIKNYYANKQEKNAYVIHTGSEPLLMPTLVEIKHGVTTTTLPQGSAVSTTTVSVGDEITFTYDHDVEQNGVEAQAIENGNLFIYYDAGIPSPLYVKLVFQTQAVQPAANKLKYTRTDGTGDPILLWYWKEEITNEIRLSPFPLENIDKIREQILATPGNTVFEIDNTSEYPLRYLFDTFELLPGETRYPYEFSQEGLAVKTYNSDLLNNWIETETQNYISTISAIDTSDGNFTIDQLNIQQKKYNMLNRIAASGGTYFDWQETVYDTQMMRQSETPMYMGGLIKELAFQAIYSSATTDTTDGGKQPLGQIAGKGGLTGKHKGGHVQIRATELSYITILVSLTPRVDYSQGNEWHTELKTLDDFHKPELDEIGFQDLPTERMHWCGTEVNNNGTITQFSAGKQPAWIDYMTEINRTYGSFAEELNEMFMTLNRRYEISELDGDIKDITTYIDPTKYNFIFAETKLDSQNFWVQIGINATVRRKMSAKLIPNL